jgi:hypothetical protein
VPSPRASGHSPPPSAPIGITWANRARLVNDQPPRWRPTVVVLDVSPPTVGPIEATTRLAAHLVVRSLLRHQIPVALVTPGLRRERPPIVNAETALDVWLAEGDEPAREADSLRQALLECERIGGHSDPNVLLLTHPWFGADCSMPAVPRLHALFVKYPNQNVRPALAAACQRREELAAGEVQGLPGTLARLLA